MYLFTLVIYILVYEPVFSHGSVTEKCCKFGEYLDFVNSVYNCSKDTTKRLEILTNSTNFLETNTDGSCVEVNDKNFFVFQVREGNIFNATTTGEDYFSKCCPLGYNYNSRLHSCEEKESMSHDFINETFVKVGLPQCKLIVDFKTTSSFIFDENLEDFCVDEDENGEFVRRECKTNIEECDQRRCVKKCCPDGQSFVNGANCVDTYTKGLNLSFSSNVEDPSEPFAVISNRTCSRIYLMNEQRYTFALEKNGVFRYWQNSSNSFVNESVSQQDSYCIEHSSRPGSEGFFFFKCYPEVEFKEKFLYTLWPKILSCTFLLLTIVIYLVLNETRNLFGKILINYCVATLLMFALLIHAQVNTKPTDSHCKLTGYLVIFFSTVYFAWLNVMCCDIWFTFGRTKQTIGSHQRRKDLKKLFGYMVYGWGMPAILTLVIFMFSTLQILPYSIQPYVGSTVCFIEPRKGNYAPALFLRLPHLIIQIINVVFFLKTISYCLRIKNEINKINDTTKHEKRNTFKRDKERLSLILKLSVIMGGNFIFDALSAFVEMSTMGAVATYIEIIWDCINCLQGVFIFIIFIFKRKIYYDFLRKIKVQRRDQSTMQSTSSSTRISMLQSAPKNGRASFD